MDQPNAAPAQTEMPRINRWPFFLGDFLLLGLAVWLLMRTAGPLEAWTGAVLFLCVAAGAWLAVIPFLAEYKAALRRAEAGWLTDAATEIGRVTHVRDAIVDATGQWQSIGEQCNKAVAGATQVFDRMAAETKGFFDFLEKSDHSEKNHLRLEAEKLKRAEREWLQTLILVFDHIFAISQAAARSGQPALVQQMGQFQGACRDVVRKLGIAHFAPQPGDAYDPKTHQWIDGDGSAGTDGLVREVLAPGVTYQGQVVRPALVGAEKRGQAITPPVA